MRIAFPLLLLLCLCACGDDPVPVADPEETPASEPPTPPPTDSDSLFPQEPLPDGESVPTPEAAPTPPPPKEAVAKPAGAAAITFDQLVVSSAVEDRKPTGVGTSFRDGTEVFCFMRVTNPGPARALRHNWYFGDVRKSSIKLTVRGPTWRTWSSRPIYGVGDWRVDVVDEEGAVLQSVPFTVK